MSGPGSIVIRNDPVQGDFFRLALVPLDSRGPAEAYFSQYQPEDRAEGGHGGASIRLHSRQTILREMFRNGLGRNVEVWMRGLQSDFEGRITEMTYNIPPDRFTITLEHLANKAHMRADVDADGNVDRSTVIQNTDSQDRFGFSEEVLAGGEIEGLNVALQPVRELIDLRAWPKPLAEFGGASGLPYLDIFCRGYMDMLARRLYNQTAITGTQAMSAQVRDILVAVGEYVASYERDANTTPVNRVLDSDRRAQDIINGMLRLGDADGNRWLADMLGRSCTDVLGRKLKMHQAAPSLPPS